ncbi:MAG: hypothetical protein QME51_07685, partial [Planctomycetota bacterium]|nr:hypothetical protein [Planctomycetota bacterium]
PKVSLPAPPPPRRASLPPTRARFATGDAKGGKRKRGDRLGSWVLRLTYNVEPTTERSLTETQWVPQE